MTRRGEVVLFRDELAWHYDPPRWWNLKFRGGTWTLVSTKFPGGLLSIGGTKILLRHRHILSVIDEYDGEQFNNDSPGINQWLLPRPRYGLTFSYRFRTIDDAMRFRLVEI